MLAGGVLLVIAVGYVLGLLAFRTQRDNGRKPFDIDSGPNGIVVDARVIGVDPETDAMTVRLEFAPRGTYAATEVALSQPVEVFINTAKGRTDTHYPKGAVMSPTEATVALNGGAPLDYPFDKYDAQLLVYAQQPTTRLVRVPVSMRVTTGSNGFKIDTSRRTFLGQGYPSFKLRRTSTTIFFAVFIMVVFWATALGGSRAGRAAHRRASASSRAACSGFSPRCCSRSRPCATTSRGARRSARSTTSWRSSGPRGSSRWP